jgi:hypothetical protein
MLNKPKRHATRRAFFVYSVQLIASLKITAIPNLRNK